MKKNYFVISIILSILIVVSFSGCNEEKNIKPTATFIIEPSIVDINTPVFFNSTSIDKDGEIKNFTWMKNDNIIGYGPKISITFQEKGSYSIQLIVKDDKGDSNTSEKSFTIGNEAFFHEKLYGSWEWSGNNQTGNWTFYQNNTLKAKFTGEAGATITDLWHWEMWLNTSKIYFDEPNDEFWQPAAYGFEFMNDFNTLKITYDGNIAYWYKIT